MNTIAREILERASDGDIGAFEQLYRAASSFVYNLAFSVTRNSADAQEVTQDVFMKVYHNLKKFSFRSSFKTWLYRITVNTAINRYRRSVKEVRNRVDYDTVVATLPGSGLASDVALENANKVMLNMFLDSLAPEYKACLILREIEGLSYSEIAVALRIPINTVRSRLNRARQALLEVKRKGLVQDAL